MDERTIHVGICLDARMLHAAFVLLASIKAHANAARPVRVFVVTDFQSSALHALADLENDARFEIVPLACTNPHDSFPVRDHISAGTYLRFLLPALLPDVDRLIYLDVDTVVNRSLETLYDTPLAGHALAAMPDWPMLLGSLTWPNFAIAYNGETLDFAAYARKALGADSRDETFYFNCGVMVFDLARWRADDIVGRTIVCLGARTDVFYMDQDALNIVIGGAYVRLDPRWNAFANCSFAAIISILVRLTRAGRRWEALRTLWRKDPWVVHYAGPNKPWSPADPKTPKDALWWAYAARSPMKAEIVSAYRAAETKAQSRKSKIPHNLRHLGGMLVRR